MLRDVFYYGRKPNVHPREKFAKDLADARRQATTEHFWVINEFCDYRNFDWDFDFEFLPDSDVWAIDHNNVWPSVYQKDSGTWLCSQEYSDTIVYRNDVLPLKRKNEKNENWFILDLIDEQAFDFGWHPDPTDPPYIYKWGCVYFPVEIKSVLEYRVPNATEIKYMSRLLRLLPENDKWVEHTKIDKTRFDLAWRPDPREPAYIYIWGNKFEPAEIKPTLEYRAPDATEIKYMPNLVEVLPEWERWHIIEDIIEDTFDFTWRPDPREPPFIFVFGNELYSGIIMPTIEYRMPGATEKKYIEDWTKPKLKSKPELFEFFEEIDKTKFDFSWRPDPNSPPYIYAWGNQWNKPEDKISVQFVVEGATEYKYMQEHAIRKPCIDNWEILNNLDISQFDFSWEPSPKDLPYIYIFGNQHYPAEIMPTIQYKVNNASEFKYMNNNIAILAPDKTNWNILLPVDENEFDFSWVPHPKDPPYIYVFGNQWNSAEIEPTLEYRTPGANQIKYVYELTAKVLPNKKSWNILHSIDELAFDFSWRPSPQEPPFIHVFGNQHYFSEIMPTIEYKVEGATEYKYHNDIKANLVQNKKDWVIPLNINVEDFDFSWVPNPNAPPYIYQFGTVFDNTDGPKYVCPNNNGEIVYLPRTKKAIIESKTDQVNKYYIKTTLSDLVNEHPTEIFWALNKNIDYSKFNFEWRPELVNLAYESTYVHVFGSASSSATHTYFVNAKSYLSGNTDLKFIEDAELNQTYLSELFVKPSIFFVDRSNKESSERFENLKLLLGERIQKTRYLNSWVETINRCCNKSTTELFYVINSELDYSNFEFDFYPNPWQMKMVHVFGTQWSHWGTTYMINKESFPNDTKYIKIVEHLNNLNFVKHKKAIATGCLHDVVLIDHDNIQTPNVLNVLKNKILDKEILVVKYKTSYLETFKQMLSNLPTKKEHYIWICSSICEYDNFDFSYTVDPFAKDQLHVFPSNNQKFGDTFFVDVNKMRELITDIDLLESYNKVNYNQTLKVNRQSAPIIITEEDTHVNAVEFLDNFPYTIFVTKDNENIQYFDDAPMSLWQADTKNILITSTGGTRVIVPKEVKDHVKTQLYDYPYIKKSNKLAISKPLDIVFLSNGEKQADENYEHLLKVTRGLRNRVTRVDGIKGRVNAYHAAANASETPWAFTVFAKLKVNSEFDWNWQPDRLQASKHYIFQAKNSVNGLIYGHQAMIAYNKKLTLKNYGEGLDFTLDDPHEVVELLSGTANFNTDPFSTWRTAFREVIKLQWDRTEISDKRLEVWASRAEGDFAQYCLDGARDALEYYTEVNGEFEKLKLSYEWDWLLNLFNSKYKT